MFAWKNQAVGFIVDESHLTLLIYETDLTCCIISGQFLQNIVTSLHEVMPDLPRPLPASVGVILSKK